MKITELKVEKPLTESARKRFDGQFSIAAERLVTTVTGGKRFAHFIIDVIAFYGVAFIFSFAYYFIVELIGANSYDPTVDLIFNIIFYFIFTICYIFFEFFFQQTPGKMIMKAYVIDEYGNKPSFKTIFLRSISRLVPFEAFSCLADRGWHDTWTKTYVVHKSELDEIKSLLKEQSDENTIDSLVI